MKGKTKSISTINPNQSVLDGLGAFKSPAGALSPNSNKQTREVGFKHSTMVTPPHEFNDGNLNKAASAKDESASQ